MPSTSILYDTIFMNVKDEEYTKKNLLNSQDQTEMNKSNYVLNNKYFECFSASDIHVATFPTFLASSFRYSTRSVWISNV